MTLSTDLRDDLSTLLGESETSAAERARTAFDEVAGPFQKRLVLYGAGNLGRKTLGGLRSIGLEPLAFSDGNSALWDSQIDGVQVLSPTDAIRRFGDSAVFVTL